MANALPDLDQLDNDALKALAIELQMELRQRRETAAQQEAELAALEAEFATQRLKLAEQSEELRTRSDQIEHLKLLVEKLRRTIFGKKSEKIVVQLKQFGEDVSEQLEYVPESFKVIRHVRPKFACTACERVVEAPAPSRPIERGLAGPALLAHVLVSKFCDHQPLYRQSEIYARQGVAIERSTLADWVGASSALLDPLVDALREHVLAGRKIHADDDGVPTDRSSSLGVSIRLCRCSRPAQVKPKPQGCGLTSAMIARLAKRRRRLFGSPTREIARANTRVRI
jgi:transposase